MTTSPDGTALDHIITEAPCTAMLQALRVGEALTEGELARIAGIGASAARAHLATLIEGGIVTMLSQGPHRYHRLASAEVAAALASLGGLAAPLRWPRRWPHGESFRAARLCYDHLAGRLGVALHRGLQRAGWLAPARDGWDLTVAGEGGLLRLGLDLDAARGARRFACDCMDWSERQPHLAGGLGRALAACCLRRHWVERLPAEGATDPLARRRVRLTPEGQEQLAGLLT